MNKIKTVTKKILGWKGLLVRSALSIILLSAFFIGFKIVSFTPDGEVSAYDTFYSKKIASADVIRERPNDYSCIASGYLTSSGNIQYSIRNVKSDYNNNYYYYLVIQASSSGTIDRGLWNNINSYKGSISYIVCNGSSFNFPSDCSGLFKDWSKLSDCDWGNGKFAPTNASSMFENCTSFSDIDLTKFDMSNCTNTSCMFKGCTSLTYLNMSWWNTSKVTNFESMFESCNARAILMGPNFRTSSGTNFKRMFYKSNAYSLDLTTFSFPQTAYVDQMLNQMANCSFIDLSGVDMTNCKLEITTWDSTYTVFGGNSCMKTMALPKAIPANQKISNSNRKILGKLGVKGWFAANTTTTNTNGTLKYYTKSGSSDLDIVAVSVSNSITYDFWIANTIKTALGTDFTFYGKLFERNGELLPSKELPIFYNYYGGNNGQIGYCTSYITGTVGSGQFCNANTTYVVHIKLFAYNKSINYNLSNQYYSDSFRTNVTSNGGVFVKKYELTYQTLPTDINSMKYTGNANNSSYTYDGANHFLMPDYKLENGRGYSLDLANSYNNSSGRTIDNNYWIWYYDSSNNYILDPHTITEPGTYRVVTSGCYPYTGSATYYFTINPKPFSNCSMSLSPTSFTYNGSAQTTGVTVKEGSTTLTTADYSVSGNSGTNAGTYTVTVQGKRHYSSDKKTATFTINKANIANASYSISASSLEYNATDRQNDFKNRITLTFNGRTLTQGTDYTVSFPSAVTNVGTYTLTVTGAGTNFNGSFTKTVSITTKGLSNGMLSVSPNSFTFDNTDHKPTLTVKDGNTTLTSGTHYQNVTYSNTKNAGTATVTVSGKGNYTGSASINYTINKANISSCTYGGVTKIEANGSNQKDIVDNQISYKLGSYTLVKGTDYTVTFPEDMTSPGMKNITITGIGTNFSGSTTLQFEFTIRDFSKCSFVLDEESFIYDGTDHVPSYKVVDPERENSELVLNTDYENVKFENYVNAGVAKVSATGTKLYAGTLVKEYTILPYDISNEDITLITDKYYEHTGPEPVINDFVIKDTRSGVNKVLSNDMFNFNFENTTAVGTGTLTITPTAETTNYTGSKTINVVINPIKMTDNRMSFYVPSGLEREYEDMTGIIRPLIVAKFVDYTLIDGTDYEVNFTDDMKSGGDKHVEIKGINNYSDVIVLDFTIKDDNPSLLKITSQSGVFRPGDEIEFDFEFSENVFGGPNFVDLTLRPNVGQIEIGSNIMKLRYVTGSTINHNLKMKYTVKEGDEILKGLNAYSSGWSQSDNIKDVSGKNLVPDTLNLMVKNDNFKIITDFATISLIKKGISSDNKNDTVAALSDRDRMSFLLDGEQGLKDRLIIEDEDPKEVQKLMLIDYLSWYFEEVEVEGTTQDEMKADIIKSLKDGIELYDVEKILSSEKSKFDQAQANGKAYTDTKKIYDLVHPLNDEQKTLMKTEFDNLLIYSYVQVESSSVNDDAKSADVKKQQSRDFIEDKVIFDKILKSSEKLSDDEKKYITDKYIEEGDDSVKERVLQRILLYLSDEKIKGGSQNENKEIILRDIYNGIWVDEVEEALKAEIEKEKPNYNWVKLLEMLEVLPLDIQYKTNKELRTFIQDGYLNWRLDEIIKGNLDDPRVPKDPQDPTKPSNPDSPKPADPKNIDPKEKKEAIIKALDDDGIIKRLLELSNLTDDEKKTVLDYIMILDSDVTDEDKEKKNENREKFLEYLADTAMGFDSIQDALQVLSKAIDDFYIIVDARLKIEEYLDIMKNDPDANYWDDILRLLDNLTDKQKQYLPEKFVEEIKKQYEEYLKQIDTKITKSGDSSGSDINIYDVISNLDPEPGDKPNIIINILNDIKNLNELRKLLTSDDVQTKLDDSNKTKQDERVIAGFEFKVVDQKDPKKVIPLKSGAKVEVIFKLPELFAGKTVSFYTIADDGTVKKEIVTMSSAVDGMCKASVLTDKYGKFVVTHNNVETIIRIKSNNGGATGTVTKSSKKSTDYICIPQSPNTVTSVKVYTYDMQTGEYKEDTKLADTLHYPTYQIYEADEVPKGSIIEIQFMTQSSGRKRVKELPSSRRFESYMKGKEVNMFKPNDGLTRAETAVLVSRIISDDKESYEAQGKKWAKKGIENVIAKEIMSTDSKGDFRENDVITRGEFAKVIYKIVEDELDPTVTKKFLDTEGKYYEEYANALLSNGLINGFSDGEFKGDLQITRSEACVMINAATGRADIADELIEDKQSKDFLEFIDVEDFRWFYKDVMLASNSFEIPNKYYVPEK